MRLLFVLLLAGCAEWYSEKSIALKGNDTAAPDSADVDTDTDTDTDSDTDTDTDTGIDPIDADADGYATDSDCNDADASVHPAATEVCDGVDQNCDGTIDEEVTLAWYADADADGYGNEVLVLLACEQPVGYVADATDCDDANALRSPALNEVCDADNVDEDCDGLEDDSDPEGADGAATYYADADLDAYGLDGTEVALCDPGVALALVAGDCDDANPAANPSAIEVCSTPFDDDCNGDTEGGPDTTTYYPDDDGDTFGSREEHAEACAAPSGWIANGDDCDDRVAAINPSAIEACDAVDNDCDDSVDEAGATGETTWYADADSDAWGDVVAALNACARPSGYVATDGDCDDGNAAAHPAASEAAYDGVDQDCDGADLDDVDLDGYTAAEAGGDDCGDSAASVHPGAAETCDGTDENCDGVADDGLPTTTWYADTDGDGYGDASASFATCAATAFAGYVTNATDCDDAHNSVHPAASESLYDVWDNDCTRTSLAYNAYLGRSVTTAESLTATFTSENLVAEEDATFEDGTTGVWERISNILLLDIADASVASTTWENTLVGSFNALLFGNTGGLGDNTDECYVYPDLGHDVGDPLLVNERVLILIDVDNAATPTPAFSVYLGDWTASASSWTQAVPDTAIGTGTRSASDGQWAGKIVSPGDASDLMVCSKHSYGIAHVAVVQY